MEITKSELDKIEQLLNSTDQANIELAITILSGFAVNDDGVKWLFDYYQKLQGIEKQASKTNLQSILLGTINLSPTKASRILTLIFEKASANNCLEILKIFTENKIITFPRLDLSFFPKMLFQISELEHINWQYGNLEHLSDEILRLPNLQTLDLRHQPLMTIDEKIVEHPTLKELWISNALIITEDLAYDANFEILIEAAY
ncbi:MAG: hypothetical protein AB8G11_00925 [Saprospiraceae bacterium]